MNFLQTCPEFILNHWELSLIWTLFLIALLWDNARRSGQSVSPALATQMINKDNALVLDIRDKKTSAQAT